MVIHSQSQTHSRTFTIPLLYHIFRIYKVEIGNRGKNTVKK